MAFIQRFIGWCLGVIVLIAGITLAYFALTNPAITANFITTVVGALVAAGKGAADIVITVVTYIGGLFR